MADHLSPFQKLEKASFAGFAFPVESIEVKGGLRDHVHEYPHSPGGAPEKLGRKLYEFHMVAILDQRIGGYDKLWPEMAASLRIIFEGGRTFDLTIPTIGTVQAYCTSWSERASSKRLSGVTMDLAFREDATDLFLVDKLVAATTSSLPKMIRNVIIIAEKDGIKTNFLDQLSDFGNQISAIGDQVELQANVLAAKAEGLASTCQQMDAQVTKLQDAICVRTVEALHDVWDAAWKLNRDALRKLAPVVPYIVPVPMSVSDVSSAIYGSTDRATEIMSMNPIPDPFRIKSGTTLLVYAPGLAG